jgi:hypothetical protein
MATYKVPHFDEFPWQMQVISKSLNSPPVIVSKGDRYIVALLAAGDWAGKENNIAVYNGSSWDFARPVEGMVAYVTDEKRFYKYIPASWEIYISSIGGSDTQVQFNNSGVLGGDSTFTFNSTTKELQST